MFVYRKNDHSISIDAWIDICKYKGKGIIKIDSEDSITLMFEEEYKEIRNWLNGRKKIPSIDESNDILGDIEGGNLFQTLPDDDYIIKDINDIVDSRGQIGHAHNIFGKEVWHSDNTGEYVEEHYPHRKGYPSFSTKMWSSTEKVIWVE